VKGPEHCFAMSDGNSDRLSSAVTVDRSCASLPLPPHVLFFLIYNLLYFLPLFAVFLWGYSEGGAADIADMGSSTMVRISCLYLTGACAFWVGSKIRRFLRWSIRGRVPLLPWRPKWLQISLAEKAIVVVMVGIFIATKVALIPTGVYKEYAFDADLMGGALWTFSMFCSETLILLAIIVLFAKSRHNIVQFTLISAVNSINLLHGTRVFLISSVMSMIAYAYVRGYLRLRRVLLYGPPSFAGILLITYAIYLSRSGASFNGALSMAKILSPLMYESMFSQLSLIGVVNHPSVWPLTGHLSNFLGDLFLFIVPRIIVPDKDTLLSLKQFDYLSPKGAFNGYAVGLIYLGMFVPAFYFLLGMFGDWLYELSRKSPWWFVLYMFFATDFLLHIMRDGYLIPMKMLINTIEWILILIACRSMLKLLGSNSEYSK
jgi:hypothetical protein